MSALLSFALPDSLTAIGDSSFESSELTQLRLSDRFQRI
jgi:hypothetical protein